MSEYIFVSELVQEYLQGGFTDSAAIEPAVKDYNDSITKLRKNELVYRSWLARYWTNSDSEIFSRVMSDVLELDKITHELNPELGAIAAKRKDKIDDMAAKAIAAKMAPLLARLRAEVKTLLMPAS